VNHRFSNVVRILFNTVSGISLGATSLAALVAAAGPSDFVALLVLVFWLISIWCQLGMSILALPVGWLALKFTYLGLDTGNDYTNFLLGWAAIFVAGWIQWALVISFVLVIIQTGIKAIPTFSQTPSSD